MSPAIELIPMQCVHCQNPIPAQPDEVFWVCATCGQAQVLSDERGLLPEVVHYAAGIPAGAKGKPIWVAQGQVSLSRQTYRGDESRDMFNFWAQPRTFFIPAYNLPLDQLMETCLRLLRQPVALEEGPTPAPFFPVTVHPEELQALAEYIVVDVEAERKDMLKELDFKLQLGKAELWIVP